MSKQLIVCDVAVKQDAEGRYCLNDLQQAATVGMNERSVELYEFTRRPETQALIAEIENTGISRIKALETKRGRNGGTYVVKQLAYAYAMWISPKFHLKVIRAYDQLATEGVAVHETSAEDVLANPLKYLRSIIDQAEQLQAERDQLAAESAVMHAQKEGKATELKLVTLGS